MSETDREAPLLDKKDVIAALEEIALRLELSGANPFKCRAFQNGSRALQSYEGDLAEGLESGELAKLKGIGKSLITEIRALLRSGEGPTLQVLRKELPAGLMDLMRIPGLGPRRVRMLYEELGITSLGELEYACNENRLVQLDGFGEKIQDKVLRGIEVVRRFGGQHLLADGWIASDKVREALEALPGVSKVEIAGSIRRRKEVIKDVDVLVATEDPAPVHEVFCSMDWVDEVTARGETKSSVRLSTGLQVDLRTVSLEQFPFALAYFTGSKEHNTRMRRRAKERGLKLNEYGLFVQDQMAMRASEGSALVVRMRVDEFSGAMSLACESESDLYSALGLHYVEPELREDLGEIAAAEEGRLPSLVTQNDLRGVLHNHSNWSDGANTIEEMARAAQAMGLEYLGISDHSRSAVYAHGLSVDRVLRQHDEIDALNERLEGFVVLKGIESDILPDGSLDYDDDLLERFDFVVASVHAGFSMSREEQTARCLRAVRNPHTSILGHPTGRLLLTREGFDLDLRAVIEAAAEVGCALELNANPHRLDLDWRELRYAASCGATISVGADAHRSSGLQDLRYGVGIARKAWLGTGDILNCLGVKELRTRLRARL